MGQWSGFKTFENFIKVPYKVKSDYFELLTVHCLKPINADWFDAKFDKTEGDLITHLLSFNSVSTQFWRNKSNVRLRDNFLAIALLFHFAYYFQNGEIVLNARRLKQLAHSIAYHGIIIWKLVYRLVKG